MRTRVHGSSFAGSYSKTVGEEFVALTLLCAYFSDSLLFLSGAVRAFAAAALVA